MEGETSKLDSMTETVVDIPFGGSDSESDFEDEDFEDEDVPVDSFPCRMHTPPELLRYDLPNGPLLRMKAYREAFDLCQGRILKVLRWLHRPIVKRVVDIVEDAYNANEEDKLLPYTELRAVAIAGSDRSATSSVLEDIQRALTKSALADGERKRSAADKDQLGFRTPIAVSTLVPADCSNLTSAMKVLISGFLASSVESGRIGDAKSKRKLASYDINLLEDWYDNLRESEGETDLPKLVILVQDLEKIEPEIIQDIFYICSLHVPRLPFIFVLGLSTPPTPSYLHAAFTRRTLALLRLTRVEVPSSVDVLHLVLSEMFFNPRFEPTVMLSPAALSFIIQQFARTAQSTDLIRTLLRLIHLRHFVDPLTVFTHDELLGKESIEDAANALMEPPARPFLLALLAKLKRSEGSHELFSPRSSEMNGSGDVSDPESDRPKRTKRGKGKESGSHAVNGNQTDAGLGLRALEHIRELRHKHKERLQKSRIAFQVVREIRRCLLEDRRIVEDSRMGTGIGSELDLMCSWFRGTVPNKEGRVLLKGLRGSDRETYEHIAGEVKAALSDWAEDLSPSDDNGASLLDLFDGWSNRLDSDSTPDDTASEAMVEMTQWLQNYLSENTRDFTENDLWDIWFTGNPTGIEEIVNPAPRAVIINALVHPERYLGNTEKSLSIPSAPERGKGKQRADNVPYDADAGQLIPDTALLFKGYLESGRMVNVYDWYMSFKEGLDARRRSERAAQEKSLARTRGKKDRQKARKRRGPRERSVSPSPSRGRVRGRGRGGGLRGRGRGGKNAERPHAEPESDEGGDASDETSDEEDMNPEERERKESEAHARFIRSIQELDLLGFIKHTGRKADHVQKTVFDLPDYV